MIQTSSEGGRVIPAAFLRSLRRLLGRDASLRQQARIIELQRQFDLAPGDSIFVVVAILEAYLQQVEEACIGVRRSTRFIQTMACTTAVVSAIVVAAPLYLLNPTVRQALGKGTVAAVVPTPQDTPFRAYMRATLDQMSGADVERLASSREALTILMTIPHATDEQLLAITRYIQQPVTTKDR